MGESTALHCEEKETEEEEDNERELDLVDGARLVKFPSCCESIVSTQPAELRCQENPPDVPTLP